MSHLESWGKKNPRRAPHISVWSPLALVEPQGDQDAQGSNN